MRRCVVLALASMLACGRGSAAGPDGPRAPRAELSESFEGSRVKYGEAVMKATHNAYEREEPLFDQLVYHRIRSLELDVHTKKSGTAAPSSDWFVYHVDVPFLRDSSCNFLSDCLGQISAFHRAVPQHEVVTLFIDLKDGFSTGHSRADLDDALSRMFGDAIVTPRDLTKRCPSASSLRESVTGDCAFPSLAELRGKIVVAVTGGSVCNGSSPVSQYAGSDASARSAFLAPDLDGACPIERYDARPDVVFLNMSFLERHRARAVRDRGLVARLYKGGMPGGLDSALEFAAAHAAGVQHLATDRVNSEMDAWSTTSSALGWPFRCAGCERNVESADLLGLRATSGDVGSDEDRVFFAFDREEGQSTWSTFVSVPSSHVEPLAKGCLMARATEAPDSVAVALCRPLDRGAPRLIVRRTRGALASWTEMGEVEGFAFETPAFMRMSLAPRGRGTEVLGEGSVDGRVWKTIARAMVGSELPLRGIAMASGGPTPAKALFGNLTRTSNGGEPALMRAASLPLRIAIGSSVLGDLFDGVSN